MDVFRKKPLQEVLQDLLRNHTRQPSNWKKSKKSCHRRVDLRLQRISWTFESFATGGRSLKRADLKASQDKLWNEKSTLAKILYILRSFTQAGMKYIKISISDSGRPWFSKDSQKGLQLQTHHWGSPQDGLLSLSFCSPRLILSKLLQWHQCRARSDGKQQWLNPQKHRPHALHLVEGKKISIHLTGRYFILCHQTI